jgi:tripartite-type tricarboxylate transporter receptor subunit TctC
MELSSWTGIFARTTVPAQRIAILNAALSQALAKPEIQKLLRTAELTPGGNSSSDFQREWLAQSARWAEVVGRTPGLKIN